MKGIRALICWCALGLACGQGPLERTFVDAARIPNLASLALARNGVIERERYYDGSGPDTPHDVRSVTKTVTSLLIGIALSRGCLRSLDQTLGELLGPDAPGDPAKAAISLRDILTMSAGFKWDELGNPDVYNSWALAPDQIAFTLAQPLAATPGTVFDYNTGAFHLLSLILTESCAPTPEFARLNLFGPLGIGARQWETDARGIANGGSGLQLTTRDLLALGRLLLDGGRFAGQQVVPTGFLADAIASHIATGAALFYDTPEYGYGIWIGGAGAFVAAEGYGGQFIFVAPRSRAVVVATANWIGLRNVAGTDFDQIVQLILTRILPAL